LLKNVRSGIATKELHDYVHLFIFPHLDLFDQNYLSQYFTITLVQGPATSGYTQGTASIASGTFTVTLGSTPTNGDVIVLCYFGTGEASGTNPSVSGISQTNVTWNSSATVYKDSGGSMSPYCRTEIWIGQVAASGTPGTTITVTVANGTGGSYYEVANAAEFSGTSTTVDTTATAAGGHSSGAISNATGTMSTANANDLLIGTVGSWGGTGQSSPTQSFTMLGGAVVGEYSSSILYNIVSVTGSYYTGVSFSNYTYENGCIAAFEASSGATNINISDTGSGSDAVTVAASLGVTDSGSGSDSAALKANVAPSADAGLGTDSIVSLQGQVPVSDSGSGSDAVASLQAQRSLVDSGSGADSALVGSAVNVSDGGSGSDALASVNVQVPISDVGLGTDALSSIIAQILAADSGLGTDHLVLGSPVTLSDSGLGTDAVGIQAQILINDVGAGLDSAIVKVSTTISDVGLGSDVLAVSVPIALSDAGLGTDIINVVIVGALPTRAIIIQAEKGTVTLQTEKGTVTLQSDSD
jgi:hypothetical protein